MTTLVVSGKTPERIASQAAMLADWMEGAGAQVALPEVAHTLNHHRTQHAKFATVVCPRPRCRPSRGCGRWPPGSPRPGSSAPRRARAEPGTVFVYSGQGSQWAGMGRRLLADEPAFAAAVAEMEPVFVEQVGFSLHEILADGEPISGDAQVQPVLMGLQLALTELWRSYGVHPDAVIGHSMGEVTAAVVAGALSTADGLRVIALRSRLMSRLAGQGAVALLNLDAETCEPLIADYPSVEIAGYRLAAPDRRRGAARPGRCRDRRRQRPEHVRPAGQHGGRLPHRADGPRPARHPRGTGRHRARASRPCRSCRPSPTPRTTPVLDADYWVANVRATGPVQPGHHRRCRGPRHLHRDQPALDAGPAHQRHLGAATRSPQHRHPGARHRRHVAFHANLNATHTPTRRRPSITPNRTPRCPPRRGTTPATGWTSDRCAASRGRSATARCPRSTRGPRGVVLRADLARRTCAGAGTGRARQ